MTKNQLLIISSLLFTVLGCSSSETFINPKYEDKVFEDASLAVADPISYTKIKLGKLDKDNIPNAYAEIKSDEIKKDDLQEIHDLLADSMVNKSMNKEELYAQLLHYKIAFAIFARSNFDRVTLQKVDSTAKFTFKEFPLSKKDQQHETVKMRIPAREESSEEKARFTLYIHRISLSKYIQKFETASEIDKPKPARNPITGYYSSTMLRHEIDYFIWDNTNQEVVTWARKKFSVGQLTNDLFDESLSEVARHVIDDTPFE